MATPAQLTANRANAQRSTGPRSVEGKSASRFNALKHGVDAASVTLPGEDPRAYQALADAYDAQYVPAGPTERFLLDTMIRADWHKLRMQGLESSLLTKMLTESPDADIINVMLSGSPAAKLLARIQRQLSAHERAWFRAHKELVRCQAEAVDSQDDLYAAIGPEESAEFEIPEPTQFPAAQPAKASPLVPAEVGLPDVFVG